SVCAAMSRPGATRMTTRPMTAAEAWNRLRQRLGVAAGMVLALAAPASAGLCERVSHDGHGYVVCTLEAAAEPDLHLWLDDASGRVYGDFSRVKADLPKGE